jgi:stage II sporulation protein AA (anti-sigma F factor antagonist)
MGSRAEFVCDVAGCFLTVRIRGEIDHHSAVSVRNGIDAAIFERRPRRLIMDMSGVTFMDSSGLGLIMGRYTVMRELGGDLVVYNPSREIQSILTLAGLERVVRIEYADGARDTGTPAVRASARRTRSRTRGSGARVRSRMTES